MLIVPNRGLLRQRLVTQTDIGILRARPINIAGRKPTLLSTVDGCIISIQLRGVTALIVLICILGFLFPGSDLIPFHAGIESSRSVQAATQATQWLFFAGACLFACTFAA